ncbi:hypothetical protein LA345_13450 [Burkholderia vietnamiensis]|uniref:HTH cro/C1-type domain-containing protein n=1 Tax=Burkholderia vietnamiensis (strain G4 / LMG 22486) TaxID=269482 RepID=A4JFW2_BURVG|nr:hypothetical protein Bcep1808_2163 [Burkholderia vietnamiensis G4]MCB4344919.1 hypothetical protein [Burkholderia vietnamiensis]
MTASTLASRKTRATPSPIRSLPELAAEARRRRKALRLTQRDLAAVAGVSRDTVIAFESAAPLAGAGEGELASTQDVGFERVLSLLSALGLGLVCVGERQPGRAGPQRPGVSVVDASADAGVKAKSREPNSAATPVASSANATNVSDAPSAVGAFDPAGAARLRWARPEGDQDEAGAPIEAGELTEAQIDTLQGLAARYIQWIPAAEAARSHASRVLARAMDLGGDAAKTARVTLLERFPIDLLRRALRYGRANGWFPAGGDVRWEAILQDAEAARVGAAAAPQTSRRRHRAH